MCAIDDCEPWKVYSHYMRRARKDHQCTECHRVVGKGETYKRINAMLDDSWWNEAICEHCLAAATWMEVVCGGYLLEGLLEELTEHWSEGYRNGWMARTIVGMRKGWRRSDGGLLSVPAKITDLVQATVGMPDYLRHEAA